MPVAVTPSRARRGVTPDAELPPRSSRLSAPRGRRRQLCDRARPPCGVPLSDRRNRIGRRKLVSRCRDRLVLSLLIRSAEALAHGAPKNQPLVPFSAGGALPRFRCGVGFLPRGGGCLCRFIAKIRRREAPRHRQGAIPPGRLIRLARQVEVREGAVDVRRHDLACRADVGFVELAVTGDAEEGQADADLFF
jgi:hypothetical protein